MSPCLKDCEDGHMQTAEKRRHLLRLWLACDDGPNLSKVMIDDAFQGGTAHGRPNGISAPGIAPIATLDPLA